LTEQRNDPKSATAQPRFTPGDPAPWFRLPCGEQAEFNLSVIAGRYVVLSFFGSAAAPGVARELKALLAERALFDDDRIMFFGISCDPADESEGRVRPSIPGVRFFRDYDRGVSLAYGAAAAKGGYAPVTLVLDPALRVIACVPYDEPRGHAALVTAVLRGLPPPALHARIEMTAPVLIVPRVFEPGFCRALIAHYESRGGEDSGFMREVKGKTVALSDHAHKRRADCVIEDPALRESALSRVRRRLLPEIVKAFHYRATRMERYIVSCYDGSTGGYFRPHRDNTSKGTAHRRFAVTLNLNAEEYEGGELRFPEFGPRLYKPPTGGAAVFSCTLLHEAMPVTKGRRYAFLPFLYDEAGAELRERNNEFLGDNVEPYRAKTPPKKKPAPAPA
jgi:peroxiredoxin